MGQSVGKHGVPLHLSHPDTSSLLPALEWLLGENVDWSCRPRLRFIVHHVSQSLVVDQPHVDVHFKLRAVDAAVHGLVAVVVEAAVEQLLTEIVGHVVVLVGLEDLILEGLAVEGH